MRTVPYGSGAGTKRQRPTSPAIEHGIYIEGRIQARLWNALDQAASNSGPLKDLGELKITSSRLDSIKGMLLDPDVDKIHLRDSIRSTSLVLAQQDSIVATHCTYFAECAQYFSHLLSSSDFPDPCTRLLTLLAAKVTQGRALGAPEGLRDSLGVGPRRGNSEVQSSVRPLEKFSWADYVRSENRPGEFDFGFRIVATPNPDRGIAYQPRFISQILDMLSTREQLDAVQLRYITVQKEQDNKKGTGTTANVLVLFRANQSHSPDERVSLAQDMFAICRHSFFVWKFDSIDLNGSFYNDYGGGRFDKFSEGSRFWINRRSVASPPKDFQFCGRGEAGHIVNLLASGSGTNQLTVTLRRCSVSSPVESESQDAYLGSVHAESFQPVVQTTVSDLQDLQDASVASAFRPAAMLPRTDDGSGFKFPAEIVFFTSKVHCSMSVVEAIGFELAGPGRYNVQSSNCDALSLEEREVFHVFRLPFGQVRGLTVRDAGIAMPDDMVPRHGTGLLLGDVLTKEGARIPFYWEDSVRSRHMYILGKTGTGKSYFLGSMISRDIEAGGAVMVIDPHGDLIDDVLRRIPRSRADDVLLFDPGDTDRPPGLNLLECASGDVFHKAFVLEEAVQIFLRLFGPEIFGPRIQQYFRGAVLSLMDACETIGTHPTLFDVANLFVNKDLIKLVRERVKDPQAKWFWAEYDDSTNYARQEILPYYQSKFGMFVSNQVVRNIVGQRRSIFRLRDTLNSKPVILINLSKGRFGESNARLLGLIFVSQICWAVMERAKQEPENRTRLSLYVDEFHNFASPVFSTMLSEGRKYGLSMIMANQYLDQLKLYHAFVREDENGLINAVRGNAGTIVCFRTGIEDAQQIQNEMRIMESGGLTRVASGSAIADLEDRQALIATSANGVRLPSSLLYSLTWDSREDRANSVELSAKVKSLRCLSRDVVESDIGAGLESLLKK